MAYTLDQFCSDLSATLNAKGQAGLPEISRKLSDLLNNPDFVAATFTEETPPGRRELWHDPATDAYVLAHVQGGGKTGKPHSHGASWPIYGAARGVTEMTECAAGQSGRGGRRGAREDQGVRASARRHPGLWTGRHPLDRAPAKAWVIRITGTDLDAIPRYHFRAKTDRIVEKV